MAQKLSFTADEMNDILAGRMHSFIQDIQDGVSTVGSPQVITAGTEYRFTNDTVVRNFVIAAPYMLDRWNTTDQNFAVPSELNTPIYLCNYSMVYDPSGGSAGNMTFRVYIDDTTVVKKLSTYVVPYKGLAENLGGVATWYFGDAAGYDAKNDGVYFTVEFSGGGDLYNKSMTLYRT